MLTLGIRYLTGYAVASDVADRRGAEWPPHPGRVFMALAAAHFQTGGDAAERAALEWLEEQRPPAICAPDQVERPVVTHYVPVNDKAGPSKAPLQSAAGVTRARQPRSFARAWLQEETVYLVWPGAQPGTHFEALDRLCRKVTRVGHSASLVQMWASKAPPERPVNWFPDETRATERFRVPGEGSLNYLERQFNEEEISEYFRLQEAAEDNSDKKRQRAARATLRERFQNQPPVRLRPDLSLFRGYAPPGGETEPRTPGTVFDPRLLVYALSRIDGPYRCLDLSATLQLTARLRESLLQHLGSAIPEVLSGHCGGGPSARPHVSFAPLPFVGHPHAHGGILGVAVAVPRDIEAADRERLLGALAGIRRDGLKLGALGCWALLRPEDGGSRGTLQERAWTAHPAGARRWATVTPCVFDRHSKARDRAAYQQEAADAIRASWQRVGEPPTALAEVFLTPVSAHLGAPASHQFPRLKRKDGSECRHMHAILTFDRPVVGPVLLGAGRYRGYGLCRPLEAET